MSDAYGRGTVRSAPEVVNLLTRRCESEVTAAETVKTAATEAFPGQCYVHCVESEANVGSSERPKRQRLSVDWTSQCRMQSFFTAIADRIQQCGV